VTERLHSVGQMLFTGRS